MPYKFWLNTTNYDGQDSIFEAAAHFCAQSAKFYDNQVTGYFFIYPNAVQGTFIGLGPMSDATKLNAFMDPILQKMASFPGVSSKSLTKVAMSQLGDLESMLPLVQGMLNPKTTSEMPARLARRHDPGEKVMVGSGILTMDSRLLGKADVESPKLAMALNKAMPKNLPDGQLRVHILTGGQVHKVGNDTSVNPAFRRAYLHIIATGVGHALAPSLRELAPDMGAYVNEVSHVFIVHSKCFKLTLRRHGSRTPTGKTHSGDPTILNCHKSKRSGIQICCSMSHQA
jgi:hypothetical protein